MKDGQRSVFIRLTRGHGRFTYLPSYLEKDGACAIDPVNLPTVLEAEAPAGRYRGLHDVLRDATPDSWGQSLLCREHNLSGTAAPLEFLLKSSNTERFGALAVGTSKTPQLNTGILGIDQLDQVVNELIALTEHRPTVNAKIRSRLTRLALGGARPKATIQDDDGCSWIVKPRLASDVSDIPMLEHFGHQWGTASGLNFAATIYHPALKERSVVRVLRFDRTQQQRHLCVSTASLLQVEYPGQFQTDKWSYPLLAEKLRLIGVPAEDVIELFGRMIFNAVCGNDDDHVRNHAIVYHAKERRWRLAPAFDVVPNHEETPKRLQLQLSAGRFDICRDSVLADSHCFGFANREDATTYLDALLNGVEARFNSSSHWLENNWQTTMYERLEENLALLRRI